MLRGIGLFIEKAVAPRYEEGIKPSLSLSGEGSFLYIFCCVHIYLYNKTNITRALIGSQPCLDESM